MIQAPVRFYQRLRGKQAFAQAEAHVRAGRREEAAAAFDLAATLSAEDAGLQAAAMAAATDLHEALGHTAQAAERIERRLALGETDPGLRRRLATLLASLGRHADAAAQLEILTAADPQDDQLWQALALARRALDDNAGELTAWRAAAAANPHKAAFHREAIRLLTAQGRLAEAAQSRLRLAEIKADNPEAWRTAARALRDTGEAEAAAGAWGQLLAVDPANIEAHRALAMLLAESGQSEPALRAWTRVIELAPDSRDARLQLGMQLFNLGRRAEAAEHLAEAAAGAPANVLLWRRLAWCRRGEENLDGEAVAWRQVLQIDPADDEARARLIEVLIEADRRGEAEPLLADLAERRPEDIRLLARLARARRDLGDEAGALKAWRRVLAVNPGEPDANQNIGEALLEAGELAAAADHLAAAAPAALKPAPAWARVVQIRRDLRDNPGEIVALQQLSGHAATFHIKSHKRLVALLIATGRLDEAEPHLLMLIDHQPSALLYRQLARARQGRGRSESEIDAWRQVLALAPDDAEAQGRVAKHLLRRGDLEGGVALLRGMARPVPSLWAMAARGYDERHDIDYEIDAWRQVLAMRKDDAPDVVEAHARLADLLISIGEGPGAIPHLTYGMERNPDDHRLRERLAGALYGAGRKVEAAEHFALVAQARPTQARPWKRYARTLEEIGDQQQALAAWRQVLNLAVDDAEAQAAIKRL
jgi:tetratricopeptide (TPR) repeat protein